MQCVNAFDSDDSNASHCAITKPKNPHNDSQFMECAESRFDYCLHACLYTIHTSNNKCGSSWMVVVLLHLPLSSALLPSSSNTPDVFIVCFRFAFSFYLQLMCTQSTQTDTEHMCRCLCAPAVLRDCDSPGTIIFEHVTRELGWTVSICISVEETK